MTTQSPDDARKDAMNRGFARMSGLLYDLNPRNFEDRWYALVGIELNMLCRRIKCNAIATAQDSIWAGNTYSDPLKLADVIVKPRPGDSRKEPRAKPSKAKNQAPRNIPDIAGEDFMGDSPDDENFDPPRILFPDKSSDDLATSLSEPEMNSSEGQTQHDVVPSASQEANINVDHTGNSQQSEGQAASHQQSLSTCTIRGGNRHRVPDSAINGFVSIDFTYDAMEEANKKRQEWTTEFVAAQSARPVPSTVQLDNSELGASRQAQNEGVQDHATEGSSHATEAEHTPHQKPPSQAMKSTTQAIHDELKKLPPSDPEDYDAIRNPYPLYRGRKIVEFKIINAESKRLPSRQEPANGGPQSKPTFDAALDNLMSSAQIGNLEQIRVFFASPHWDHQESVMLFATAGDFQTHTIATRETETERPTFSIQPWSMPVWYGSEASKRREDKVIEWINEKFSPEAMMAVAHKLRYEAVARQQKVARQRTPPEDDNADNADGGDGLAGPPGPPGPSGPPGPPEPPANPKTRKRNRDRRNPEKPRRSTRNRTGNPYARTIAQNEHADAPPPVPPMPGTGDESGTNHGRPAQDTANRAAAQPEPSGTSESASRAPPTRRTKPLPRRLGPSGPGDLKGKGKARAEPVVENEQDDDSSAQSEPDDARPTKKAREHLPAEASDASEAPPPDSPAFSDTSTLTDISVLAEQIQKDNDALTPLQREKKRILEIQALQAAARRPINRALTGQPSVLAGPSGANGQRSVQEPSRLTRSRSTRY